ncbi:putative MFS family arabinose efflux permease [Stella humosa]|uniref:Putative MFS family arabinose efflux permease n=2 Tax=Stella humosa TaxID=94 RepID=A0A3N1LKZ6_9PROT|nr:MFS transporter [Stella humosa]ROP91096.1 putative MFS family arabinose efflux permease [Stella humosa]
MMVRTLKVQPGTRLLWAVIAAQMLTQIGAFTLPALLPTYIDHWHLTRTEAGWLVGIFFAGYVASVPVLLALTDRLPARRIYLLGAGLTAAAHLGFGFLADGFWSAFLFRALAGIGWAGAYMPGLKILADGLDGDRQARAVSWHAAAVGAASALSFAVAGAAAAIWGEAASFRTGGFAAATGFFIAALWFPATTPAQPQQPRRLLAFGPVLRNRRAVGWIVGYAVHTWEMAALRAWGVTFLATALVDADGLWASPTMIFTLAGIVGIASSLCGNELAIRLGRRGLVTVAMLAGGGLAVAVGWVGVAIPWLAPILLVVWMAVVYLDSSALTSGTVQVAEPGLRGATLGLHSMAGYAGGLIGPLGVGLALDLGGGNGTSGWGLGFGHLAVVSLAGLLLLRRLGAARPAA